MSKFKNKKALALAISAAMAGVGIVGVVAACAPTEQKTKPPKGKEESEKVFIAKKEEAKKAKEEKDTYVKVLESAETIRQELAKNDIFKSINDKFTTAINEAKDIVKSAPTTELYLNAKAKLAEAIKVVKNEQKQIDDLNTKKTNAKMQISNFKNLTNEQITEFNTKVDKVTDVSKISDIDDIIKEAEEAKKAAQTALDNKKNNVKESIKKLNNLSDPEKDEFNKKVNEVVDSSQLAEVDKILEKAKEKDKTNLDKKQKEAEEPKQSTQTPGSTNSGSVNGSTGSNWSNWINLENLKGWIDFGMKSALNPAG